jgi:hypothetical protein
MQIAGSAFRITAQNLASVLPHCPAMEKTLQRYFQELAMQGTQVAACNRLHPVEARLARWLLMSMDRIGGNLVPLTQEFLAHMLGTRRASVTVAAAVLQRAGLITCTRGRVQVKSRAALQGAACECYRVLTRQSKAWGKERLSFDLRANRSCRNGRQNGAPKRGVSCEEIQPVASREW